MKTVIRHAGIDLIPETYAEKLYLVHFNFEVSQSCADNNIDLQFSWPKDHKTQGEASADWAHVESHYWLGEAVEYRKKIWGENHNERRKDPIKVEWITKLSIFSHDL